MERPVPPFHPQGPGTVEHLELQRNGGVEHDHHPQLESPRRTGACSRIGNGTANWNTPREGWNGETPARPALPGCSAFQRPEGGTAEHDEQEKDTTLSSAYRRRITGATSWDDLYAVLAEVDVACLNGVLSHDEVKDLDSYAADRSRDVHEHAEDERLSDLLARQRVARVRSRMLGEVVVWVADDADLPEETGEVVYRESELRRLVGRTPTEVRAIHKTKRAIDGELVS